MSRRHVHYTPGADATDQLGLLALGPGDPVARQADPETSKAAARRMRDSAQAHNGQILAALRAGGPMTYVEIAAVCTLEPVQVARRMAALLEVNLVRRLDETRPTPSGCDAHLWEAA